MLYWDGKRFVPVQNSSGLGVTKDQFNTTTFDEVRTSKLRLEMDGNGLSSTGILEWKVYSEGEVPNYPPSVNAGGDRAGGNLGRAKLAQGFLDQRAVSGQEFGFLSGQLSPGQPAQGPLKSDQYQLRIVGILLGKFIDDRGRPTPKRLAMAAR